MQKVTILCVGKLKERFYIDAAAEYVKRLQRLCRLEVIELPESRLPDDPSPAELRRALQTEAAAIRERLPKGGALVALCIEGKPCSSEELSRRLTDFGVQGKTQITFLIGGSVGLDGSLKQQADWRLSMSPMTFPHHMARIMLLQADLPRLSDRRRRKISQIGGHPMENWSFTGRPDVPAWPKDEAGHDERAVLLKQTFDSAADADTVISLLSAYGVPCFKYYDREGGAGKVINGFSGFGVSLYVPASRLEEAQELLTSRPVEEDE